LSFKGFQLSQIDLGDVSLRVRHGGSGPPLLLLHGFPETHMMWAKVAPDLARDFTVIAPDLRGYGVWRGWAGDLRGEAIDCGHFIPEEKPAETIRAMRRFFAEGR
jgi:pimeloyl-ACP methyl ester carboxylesterase